MPELNILRIQDGDSQKSLIEKLNYNFSRISDFKGGPYGIIGAMGLPGNIGPTGPTGPYGDNGQRGNIWYLGTTEPAVYVNDLWLNAKDNNVYIVEANKWKSSDINIQSQDLFRKYNNIMTTVGASDYNGYFISSANPEKYTFVLGDNYISDSSDIQRKSNPQYSKMVINTNNGVTGGRANLIEFSKSSHLNNASYYLNRPRLFWSSTSTVDNLKYNLSFTSNGLFIFDIPNGDLILKTLSGNDSGINILSSILKLNSNGDQPLSINSLNGNTNINIGSNGTLLISTRNISYANNRFNISTSIDINGTTNIAYPLIIESKSSSTNNIRYKSNTISDNITNLFQTNVNNEILCNVSGKGEFYYNKKINALQNKQVVTGVKNSSINWIFALNNSNLPFSVDSNISIICNTGDNYVFECTGATGSIGVSLWTPKDTEAGDNNNKNWLNLLNNYESINFKIRASNETTPIRYIALNTSDTYNTIPIIANENIVDLSGNSTIGASCIDFTIMNIKGTGTSAPTSRWFKVYYSAYGGNLPNIKSGCLYTKNSIVI